MLLIEDSQKPLKQCAKHQPGFRLTFQTPVGNELDVVSTSQKRQKVFVEVIKCSRIEVLEHTWLSVILDIILSSFLACALPAPLPQAIPCLLGFVQLFCAIQVLEIFRCHLLVSVTNTSWFINENMGCKFYESHHSQS